jgi:DNA-binding NtrC family response regulator
VRVLIVDDDALYRGLIVEALCYEGHDVVQASNAANALRLLSADSNFAVILCDLQMNGLDGLELLQELRASYPHIPVVVSSAHSSEGGIGERARREAAHYLSKPFRITTLVDVIENVAQLRVNRA